MTHPYCLQTTPVLNANTGASSPNIVCLGFINPGIALAVPKYPAANGGTFVQSKHAYLGSDAVIVARALAHWGSGVRLLTNALGDDDLGRNAQSQLHTAGVACDLALLPNVATPLEIDVCDQEGKRTWFVEQAWSIFGTINQVDLSPIRQASMLYVDWYAGDDIVTQAVEIASTSAVPIYLNVEFDSSQPNRYARWISQASIVQTWINDDDVTRSDPVIAWELAEQLYQLGAKTAVVTRGKHGCLAYNANERICLQTPAIPVIGTLGAGAIFSAGMMYAHQQGVDLLKMTQFAMQAASLKCRSLAPDAPSLAELGFV